MERRPTRREKKRLQEFKEWLHSKEGEDACFDTLRQITNKQYCVWVTGGKQIGEYSGFSVRELPPVEHGELFQEFLSLHQDRLRALLDKWCLLAVLWDDGDNGPGVFVRDVEQDAFRLIEPPLFFPDAEYRMRKLQFLKECYEAVGPEGDPFDESGMFKAEYQQQARELFDLSDDRSHIDQVDEQCGLNKQNKKQPKLVQ